LSNTSKKISRIDALAMIEQIKKMVESLYTEVIIIEQALCEIGSKLNIDEDVLENLCYIEVNNE